MINWNLLFDLNALLFILLSLVYSIRIYRKVRIRGFVWLIIASAYGSFLRSLHFLRNFKFPVPDALTVSRMFALFYILLFLGVMAYYKPIKEMWDSAHSN